MSQKIRIKLKSYDHLKISYQIQETFLVPVQ